MNVSLPLLFLVLSFMHPMESNAALEDHSPIVIDDPTDLLVPDAVSGSGVRGGTGTALDPFRIESWTIRLSPGEAAGIVIRGISLHVAINHIEVIGGAGQADNATGVVILASGNVSILDLRVNGLWRGVAISGSSVGMADLVLAGPVPAPPTESTIPDPYNFPRPALLAITGSKVHLDGFDMRGSTQGITWGYSSGVLAGGRIANVSKAIHVFGYEHLGMVSDLEVIGAVLEGPTCLEKPAHQTGVSVFTESVVRFTLTGSVVRCFATGLALAGAGPPAGPLMVAGNTFTQNEQGLDVVAIAESVHIKANNITHNEIGLRLALDKALVRTAGWLQGNTWTSNGVAIEAHHTPCPPGFDCTNEHQDQSQTAWSSPPAPGEWVVTENTFRGNRASIEYDPSDRPPDFPEGYKLNAQSNDWPGCGVRRSGADHISGPIQATDSAGPCEHEAGLPSGTPLLLPLLAAFFRRGRYIRKE